MFKTGIYRVEQLSQSKNFKTILGKDKNISITLYNELVPNGQNNDILERILLSFVDDRGTFKRTYSNRFEAFDQQVLQEIRRQFPADKAIIIHDAAISDGRTACDFFDKIQLYFPKVHYYASDYDPNIFVIESGRTKVVINKESKILEIVFPPFVFNRNRDAYWYTLNHLIRFLLEKTIVKRMISKYYEGVLRAQECQLFCLQANKLARNDIRFQLMQHDLLKASPLSQSIDIFRVMNILNLSYFTPFEFDIIVEHIFNALSDQGLFIMGSNQESSSIVHGGIFQKAQNGFKKIGHSGDGSAIESIILNYIPASRN